MELVQSGKRAVRSDWKGEVTVQNCLINAESPTAQEVFTMRTVIALVHMDCANESSILNVVDDKKKTVRKQLGIHIQNCKQALTDVDSSLKRYKTMSAIDRVAWSWKGHSEVKDLESNLSSFATQLNTFVNSVTMKGVGAVYRKQIAIQSGISRIEEAMENAKGDDKLAIQEVMQEVSESTMPRECTERYRTIISDYVHEVSQSPNLAQSRAQTPEPSRGRKGSSSTLIVPGTQDRARSADNPQSSKGGEKMNVSLPKWKASYLNKAKLKLECWLIQIRSGHLTIVTWQFCEKELQCRGQWKLEEMAQQFRASKQARIKSDHDLVNWVIKDRNKNENDSDFVWRPYAAKMEQKGSLALNLGVEEQAMVIIQRHLSSKAQAKAEEERKRMAAQRQAEHKNLGKGLAERGAADAAAKKAKDEEEKHWKAKNEIAKKKDLIMRLEQENQKLKALNTKVYQEMAAKRKEFVKNQDTIPQLVQQPNEAADKARGDTGGKKGQEDKKEMKEDISRPQAKQKTPSQVQKTGPPTPPLDKLACWSGDKCTKKGCRFKHPDK